MGMCLVADVDLTTSPLLLCRLFLMLQAVLADCLLFDRFPFSENGFVAAEVISELCPSKN
jgi:hypothetical protein